MPPHNLARFDFLSIRLAVACARTGSLTAAARECRLVVPAASRRLKDLEDARQGVVHHIRLCASTAAISQLLAPLLAGLKVLELGQLIAGPFAARTLADFGAEVIKIEAPGSGDPLRQWRL